MYTQPNGVNRDTPPAGYSGNACPGGRVTENAGKHDTPLVNRDSALPLLLALFLLRGKDVGKEETPFLLLLLALLLS